MLRIFLGSSSTCLMALATTVTILKINESIAAGKKLTFAPTDFVA